MESCLNWNVLWVVLVMQTPRKECNSLEILKAFSFNCKMFMNFFDKVLQGHCIKCEVLMSIYLSQDYFFQLKLGDGRGLNNRFHNVCGRGLQSDKQQFLHHNRMFIKVDVALWHLRVLSHCNNHESICRNVTDKDVFVRFLHSPRLTSNCDRKKFRHIAMFIKVECRIVTIRAFVTCDIHQGLCCIVTFKGFVTLKC